MERKYYEAYDDRYRQVHRQELQWFHDLPSPIVKKTIDAYGISKQHKLLELGCGEGRDAFPLLVDGYDLTATDISPEAVRFCRERDLIYGDKFRILDCVHGEDEGKYDFIYAVALVHMLVEDEDRNAFYRFIREHLRRNGLSLICTMGDGNTERCSDIRNAFDLQERIHEQTGKMIRIASTSCRMVTFETFYQELTRSGFEVIDSGITSVDPDFPQMMYALIREGEANHDE